MNFSIPVCVTANNIKTRLVLQLGWIFELNFRQGLGWRLLHQCITKCFKLLQGAFGMNFNTANGITYPSVNTLFMGKPVDKWTKPNALHTSSQYKVSSYAIHLPDVFGKYRFRAIDTA